MSTFGPYYRVVKTIKGRRYIYDQATMRRGRYIYTRNRYIGPEGGWALRASLVGLRDGPAGAIHKVRGAAAKAESPALTYSTLADGMRQIKKEGGFANCHSRPAVNAYAATELGRSLGLNKEYLYAQAMNLDIDLQVWLKCLDAELEISKRIDVGQQLMAVLSVSEPVVISPMTDETWWAQWRGVHPAKLVFSEKNRTNPRGFFKMALGANVVSPLKPIVLEALSYGDNIEALERYLQSTKRFDVRAGADYMRTHNISLDVVLTEAKRLRALPKPEPAIEAKPRIPPHVEMIREQLQPLFSDRDLDSFSREKLHDFSANLEAMNGEQILSALRTIRQNNELGRYFKDELQRLEERIESVVSRDKKAASVTTTRQKKAVPVTRGKHQNELADEIVKLAVDYAETRNDAGGLTWKDVQGIAMALGLRRYSPENMPFSGFDDRIMALVERFWRSAELDGRAMTTIELAAEAARLAGDSEQ